MTNVRFLLRWLVTLIGLAWATAPAVAGTIDNPATLQDCHQSPEMYAMHAAVQEMSRRYKACFDRIVAGSNTIRRLNDSVQTTCTGGWPRECVQFQQRKCDLRARFERKRQICVAKLRVVQAEQRRAERAQREFVERQEAQARRAEEAERARRAARQREIGAFQRYQDSTVISSHLAARMSGLRQPPLGGGHYLSQTLTSAGTRLTTNAMAEALLGLERAVQGRVSAGTYDAPVFGYPNGLSDQIARTGGTTYQLPFENMSVESALVSSFLTILVQSQLDGASVDLTNALAQVVALGVSSLLDDRPPASSSGSNRDRGASMMERLAADQARQAEEEERRNRNYNNCLKTSHSEQSGGTLFVRGTNTCKLKLRCSIEPRRNSERRFLVLAPGSSMSRVVPDRTSGHDYWYGCILP